MVSAGRRIKPEKGRQWRARALSRGLVKEDDVRTESCMTQVGRTRRHRRGHPAGGEGAEAGRAGRVHGRGDRRSGARRPRRPRGKKGLDVFKGNDEKLGRTI